VAAGWGSTAPRWIGPIQALLVQQEAVMAASSASHSPDGRQRHILAVNNDQMVLGLFRDLLDDAGYQVTTQTYLDKDLEQLAQLAPDLIILDYMWAEEDNGWAYLQLLRMDPRTVQIPIVLCTGAIREVEALAAHLEDMGVQVVLKPFNIDRLLDVIADALALAAEAEPAPEA
jgi:CheY-like chemotaxis protein